MASTYSSNIRLTKQGDGDNPNTWGEVLNGVLSLVDQAITDYTVVTIGSTNSVVLTNNNGSPDQARSATIEFQGSIGGAETSIFVYIPAKPKIYAVRNAVSANTTASDALILKVAGNDGVTVAAGNNFYISNGTSVFAVGNQGTAGSRDVGVCTTNIPDTSLADIRYVPTSVSSTIVAEKHFTKYVNVVGASASSAAGIKVGTNARAYNTITNIVSVSACITIDFAVGNNFLTTLGANKTLKAPANAVAGQTGSIYIVQDGDGSRTLSYNTVWKFPKGSVPVATTTSAGVDLIAYSARSATTIDAVMLKDFKR